MIERTFVDGHEFLLIQRPSYSSSSKLNFFIKRVVMGTGWVFWSEDIKRKNVKWRNPITTEYTVWAEKELKDYLPLYEQALFEFEKYLIII